MRSDQTRRLIQLKFANGIVNKLAISVLQSVLHSVRFVVYYLRKTASTVLNNEHNKHRTICVSNIIMIVTYDSIKN